jgi:hypothetical protein
MTKLEANTLASTIRVAFQHITVLALAAGVPTPEGVRLYLVVLMHGSLKLSIHSPDEWTFALTAHALLSV